MFEAFRDFFAGSKDSPAALMIDQEGAAVQEALVVASAVLLVEMARADKSVAPQEGAAVVKIISEQFGVPQSEVPRLIEAAVAARKEQGRIDRFVECINRSFDAGQRQRLLAMLWRVVAADGSVDKYEERLAVQMKCRLQLTDEQAAAAREMAEKGVW